MKVQACADHPQSKPCVLLTGTANNGNVGPPVGLVDIGVSQDAYLFRVALPGVQNDKCKVSCEIQCDGLVHIEGVTTDGTFKKSVGVYQAKLQQLCPPGPFTISFTLPGPVDPRLFSPKFRPDGILEAVARKSGALRKLDVDG